MRRAIPLAVIALAIAACTNPQVTEPQSKAMREAPSSAEYQAVTLDDALCKRLPAEGCRLLVLVASGACDREHGAMPAPAPRIVFMPRSLFI